MTGITSGTTFNTFLLTFMRYYALGQNRKILINRD